MSDVFLIVDGYPRHSRDEFIACGSEPAWKLYARMLKRHLPDAEYRVVFPSDEGASLPDGSGLQGFRGVLWTGCNLTIYDEGDWRVRSMVELARTVYSAGVPSFGSCWGLQIAVVAAGGEVAKNPKGREMGIGRKILLTEQGRAHPMYRGKPAVFDGFISHYDEVVRLPAGARHLAGNEFTRIQAVAVEHEKGTFWATQYHPEYDLHDMARLIVARTERLLKEGFFPSQDDLQKYVDLLEQLWREPERRDLRWSLAIDDDVLDADRRQIEFRNWLDHCVRDGAR
ncbi:MAG: type 1 glutamine amidotransferase [Deltaproteobacteria bacterium]|nr:MAG: type 1 glutamine amidotransferase [Deltaproteobacteria bacterium]